jgi:hypothetical protein
MHIKNIILVSLLLCRLKTSSQTTQIEYKGGFTVLKELISKNIILGGNQPIMSTDSNRYYSVLIWIENNGSISSVNITSIGGRDSSEVAIIVDAIKLTQGNWVNHSGKGQVVVLPISYIFAGERFLSDDKSIEKRYLTFIRTFTLTVSGSSCVV